MNMKKFFIGMAMAAMLLVGMTSCSCNQNGSVTDVITWSAKVSAQGEGELVVTYPSGALNVNGAGLVKATSYSDSLKTAALLGSFETVQVTTVLESPANFTKEQVAFAQEAQAQADAAFSATAVSGTWAVDVELYAVQPQTGMAFVFVKHWPEEE